MALNLESFKAFIKNLYIYLYFLLAKKKKKNNNTGVCTFCGVKYVAENYYFK